MQWLDKNCDDTVLIDAKNVANFGLKPCHEGKIILIDAIVGKASINDRVNAAGALYALMLLSGKTTITTEEGNNELPLTVLKDIKTQYYIEIAFYSRLFEAKSEDNIINYTAPQRTIAEFLAAKWLVEKANRSKTPLLAEQIRDRIQSIDGIPTSLRGLNCWIAYHDSQSSNLLLSKAVIQKDPYGVLVHADTSSFSNEQSDLL